MSEDFIIRKDAFNAVTAHDAQSTVLTPAQYVDGLMWLRNEIIKTMAPFAVRKEFESKSALCRMFQVSAHTVNKVLKASRIEIRKRSNGQLLYNTRDFELAFKANQA